LAIGCHIKPLNLSPNSSINPGINDGLVFFVPATVVVELEWVLRSSFGFIKDDVMATLARLFSSTVMDFR